MELPTVLRYTSCGCEVDNTFSSTQPFPQNPQRSRNGFIDDPANCFNCSKMFCEQETHTTKQFYNAQLRDVCRTYEFQISKASKDEQQQNMLRKNCDDELQ